MGMSEHVDTESYAWRLDKVQSLCEFCQFYLYDILGPKCFDTPKSSATIRVTYPKVVKRLPYL